MTNYDMDEIMRELDICEERDSEWMDGMIDAYPKMVRLEPKKVFDKAIIGIAQRVNLDVLCYDVAQILNILKEDMGVSEEDVQEYFDFNISGSWMGEHTPVFLTFK